MWNSVDVVVLTSIIANFHFWLYVKHSLKMTELAWFNYMMVCWLLFESLLSQVLFNNVEGTVFRWAPCLVFMTFSASF